MNIKKHSFEPGAMSIIQMGEELIGHPTTAINELVKNGYDADATEVYVYINLGDSNFIAIFDNGLGMFNKTLFGDWLRPSVSSKRIEGVKSEIFERSFLGSKGIGRLAAMALGKKVTVITKRNEEHKYNWLTLDSSLFKSDKLLSQIKFPGDVISNYKALFTEDFYLNVRDSAINESLIGFIHDGKIGDFKEGTLIIIEDVDEAVKTIFRTEFENQNENEDALTLNDTSIYRGLSVLITPFKLNTEIQKELLKQNIIDIAKKIAKEDNLFQVYFGSNIIANENTDFEFISVKPIPIVDIYDYRVIGKVTKSGNISGKFRCKRLKDYEFEEDFLISSESVFEKTAPKSKVKRKNVILSDDEWNADAGEFYFDIRVYDRGEDDSREKLFSLVPASSVEQKKKIIDKLLGLRLSKNGFGIKPYGEEIKDWLDLSQIRVQNPGQNVSVNQILGYVFFYSPENDGLKEKTNREGYYENKAFIDVKHILQTIVKNLGQLRYNFRLRYNLGRIPRNRLQRPDTKGFIEFIRNNPESNSVLRKSEEFVKEISTALDNMEDTLSFSQRLASLGTGLELVYHELGQPIAKIGGSRAIMNRRVHKISDNELKNLFVQEITHIGSFVSELDELKSSLKPAIGRSRHQLFKPNHTFKKVCYLFRKDFGDDNIEMLIQENSENYEVEDFEYPLWISFLNIVNNAVYWLKLNEGKRKFVSFSIEGKNNLVLSNNGPFIPEDYIDLIFEYGFTLKKEKSATGLGLAFTKNILNLNNWNITVENRKEGPAFLISKKP